MKKVDLNFEIEGGQNNVGQPFKLQASKGLADLLETQQGVKEEVKIIKHFGWARLLRTSGILELDDGDLLELKNFVKDHPTAFLFFKHPVMQAFSQPPAPGTGGKDKDKDKND